jgi:hypothetical protein
MQERLPLCGTLRLTTLSVCWWVMASYQLAPSWSQCVVRVRWVQRVPWVNMLLEQARVSHCPMQQQQQQQQQKIVLMVAMVQLLKQTAPHPLTYCCQPWG